MAAVAACFFVEIVNLNVRNTQYVCAGDLRALDLLQRAVDDIKKDGSGAYKAGDRQKLDELVARHLPRYKGVRAADVVLRRGTATVPLPGVDVPFHSSLLRPRMAAFRRVLLANVDKTRLRPDALVGRYVPNVTGRPFEISKEYIEEVAKVTRSERLRDVLNNWEDWMARMDAERASR